MTDQELTEDERELLRLLKNYSSAWGFTPIDMLAAGGDILAHYRKAKAASLASALAVIDARIVDLTSSLLPPRFHRSRNIHDAIDEARRLRSAIAGAEKPSAAIRAKSTEE